LEFTYTPEQLELRERAAELARALTAFEEPCEAGRGLDDESLRRIRELTIEAQLNAINMPAQWGGQGLSILEQVIVQEQLGQLTNALWDTVWRPANALRHCTEPQRARYLVPAIEGRRRDCFAVTEAQAGSDPSLIETVAEPDGDGGYRISGEKWFVTVGDVADFLIVLALVLPERAPTLFLVDKDLPGVAVKRVPAYMHTFVYEHPEFVFDQVQVGPESVLGEVGGGYRADPRVVRRGAADDRRALPRRRRAGTTSGQRLGRRARAVRPADRRQPDDRRDDRRQRLRHRAEPRAGLPGGLGG
jgi:acyl-CoA dehydrogenase